MYSSNSEYRQLLRNFFKMNVESVARELSNAEHCDDESYDELLYDSTAVQETMDYILKKTENNHLFKDLYELAAAKIFSTDKPSGLCILLSYDFFQEFHAVWMLYDMNEPALSASSEAYVTLKNKLMNR